MTRLAIVDELIIHEDGTTEGWACAFNDLGLVRIPLRDCAATRHACARGFTEPFACRKVITDAEAD